MDTRIITTFDDTENGVAAVVAQIAAGYSVTIVDTDTGEALDTVLIYATEAAAVAKAQTIAGGRA